MSIVKAVKSHSIETTPEETMLAWAEKPDSQQCSGFWGSLIVYQFFSLSFK